MKWLEVISLRTAGVNEKEVRMYLHKFCRLLEKYNLSKANLYIHSSIPGDFALVISSENEQGKIIGTALGNYMADVLKRFGLVDYNCWVMMNHE